MHIYSLFINYKIGIEYKLLISPQVCFLEKFLNDHYDFDLRRIAIADPDYKDTSVLYLEAEDDELVMYNEGENEAEGVFYTSAEANGLAGIFIVTIPAELNEHIPVMTAQLKALKLPTTKFEITNG
ncbi:hypothetical protein ABDK00_001690 [Niabella insulamsoli]|uniref:hypothetical protein n=1 Tax=Niabella insulamsoli TaxID=3144874 RepID=UPI0031FBFDAE